MAFLFHYFFICLMFVLYINPVCKPLQISQIEYSDGPSIILNLSSSKNIVCFVIHLAIDLCPHCLHLRIYLSMYLSSFFFYYCAECFLQYIFPSCLALFFIYRLSMNVSFCLVYFSSFHCFSYSGLYFVLFLDLNNYLSIYILVIGFLISLLFHPLHKSCLQTAPDFTDRIFRWTIHHSEPLRFQKILFACLLCHLFSYWFLFSIACIWILMNLFVYLFSRLIPVLNVFCFIPFISCILFLYTDYLWMYLFL